MDWWRLSLLAALFLWSVAEAMMWPIIPDGAFAPLVADAVSSDRSRLGRPGRVLATQRRGQMAADETDAGMEPAGGGSAAPANMPMANVSATEQIMGGGALLILVVTDLIGDIVADEYSISRVTWIFAVAVLAAIWANSMAGKTMLTPYRPTMIVLGYGTVVLVLRELISDIESSRGLGSYNIVYALAAYAGALLIGYGAYRMARSQ